MRMLSGVNVVYERISLFSYCRSPIKLNSQEQPAAPISKLDKPSRLSKKYDCAYVLELTELKIKKLNNPICKIVDKKNLMFLIHKFITSSDYIVLSAFTVVWNSLCSQDTSKKRLDINVNV